MKQSMALGLLLLMALPLSANVYKSYDKDGNVVYSDAPKNDQAKAVALPTLNTLSPSSAAVSGPSAAAPSLAFPAAAGDFEVTLISPRAESSIAAAQNDLPIVVAVSPQLGEYQTLQYLLNGEVMQETQSTNIVINQPPRGSVTLQVNVVDEMGDVISSSPAIVVHLLRFPSPLTRQRLNSN